MDGFTPNNQPIFETKKIWYKTTGGVIFLIIISFFILGVISFMALFGYYTWQVKYGDATVIEQLDQKFGSISDSTKNLVIDINKQAFVENYSFYIKKFDPVKGDKQAPVTIIAFIDFECPFCQATYSDFASIMKKYESVVRVVFKNLPIISLHPNAMVAAQAAMCANEQGQFWSYYDILFQEKVLDLNGLNTYAKNLNLNQTKFSDCVLKEEFGNEINEDMQDAVNLNLHGTPTYLVNGFKIEGVLTLEQWDSVILQLLN